MQTPSAATKTKRPWTRDAASVLLGTASILLIPLAAMRLGFGLDWSAFDFALMGSLIATTGTMFVVVARTVKNSARRMLVGVALALALLLLWAELAVGVFGSPIAGS